MPNAVTTTGLQIAAEHYDPTLRHLPFFAIADACKALGFNVIKVDNKDVLTNVRRHAGGTIAYVPGANPITYKDGLVSFEHSALQVEETVFKTKDNVQNYHNVNVQYLGGKPVDDTTKKHPLEYMILKSIIRSHAEEVMFAMWAGVRNTAIASPMSAFDGVYKQIDTMITAGSINAGRGNYAPTGAFDAPVDTNDYSAYENLVDFIGGAHNMLRNAAYGGAPELVVTEDVLINVRAALRNKLKSFDYPTMEKTLNCIREDAMCPGLVVRSHISLGTGSRVILQKPGNIDFGWNSQTASQFVQVRNIFEDPNEVQFWLQSAYGTRVRDWHEKLFRVNEQTNSVESFAGDDATTGALLVNITGPSGARWHLDGSAKHRATGQYLLNVPAGAVTIKFNTVDGYTSPSDISATVVAGTIVTETATYTETPAETPAETPET